MSETKDNETQNNNSNHVEIKHSSWWLNFLLTLISTVGIGVTFSWVAPLLIMFPAISEITLTICQKSNYICKQLVTSEEDLIPLEMPDRLTSDQGINYQYLRYYLASGKWQEADQETTKIILKLAQSDQISLTTLVNIPNKDLITIDYLWTKYSQGHFGFSIQGQIWQDLGGNNQEYLAQIEQGFKQRIGRSNNQINYNLDAPEGHLPSAFMLLTDLALETKTDISSISGFYRQRGNIYCHHWHISFSEKSRLKDSNFGNIPTCFIQEKYN
jgi:hypothetical protein